MPQIHISEYILWAIAAAAAAESGFAPVVALLGTDRTSCRFAVWDNIDDPVRLRSLSADEGPPGSALAAARLLRTVLFRVQLGDVDGLRRVAPDHADAILAHAEQNGWLETIPLS